eukprot:1553980-Ditylum_brightwellii.AAC.1
MSDDPSVHHYWQCLFLLWWRIFLSISPQLSIGIKVGFPCGSSGWVIPTTCPEGRSHIIDGCSGGTTLNALLASSGVISSAH